MLNFASYIDWPGVAIFVAIIWAVWIAAGFGKTRGWLQEGDARKLNHFTTLVGGVAWFRSSSEMTDRVSCHIACGILFLSLLVVCRYSDVPAFRYAFAGYARESDRPNAAFHVWFSWLVSLLGLEMVDLLFGSLATTRLAALVLGVADALAEPIGRRFGKHRYRVAGILSPHGATRSWEGSITVALSTLVVILLFGGMFVSSAWPVAVGIAFIIGLIVALIEAWTPHGLDNLTIPLSTACLVRILAVNPWA